MWTCFAATKNWNSTLLLLLELCVSNNPQNIRPNWRYFQIF